MGPSHTDTDMQIQPCCADTDEPSYIFLGCGNLSCFDLFMCRPISVHLMWRLLDNLCKSGHFPVSLCVPLSFRKSAVPTIL